MHVSSSIKELIADRWLSGASPDHLAACLDRTGRDEWMDALCGRWHCRQLVDCDWEGESCTSCCADAPSGFSSPCIASLGPLLTALSMRSRTLQFAFSNPDSTASLLRTHITHVQYCTIPCTHTHTHTQTSIRACVSYHTMRGICRLPLARDSVSQKLATASHATPTHPQDLVLALTHPAALTHQLRRNRRTHVSQPGCFASGIRGCTVSAVD